MYDARFREAVERPSKRGNEMIEVVLAVPMGMGTSERFATG